MVSQENRIEIERYFNFRIKKRDKPAGVQLPADYQALFVQG